MNVQVCGDSEEEKEGNPVPECVCACVSERTQACKGAQFHPCIYEQRACHIARDPLTTGPRSAEMYSPRSRECRQAGRDRRQYRGKPPRVATIVPFAVRLCGRCAGRLSAYLASARGRVSSRHSAFVCSSSLVIGWGGITHSYDSARGTAHSQVTARAAPRAPRGRRRGRGPRRLRREAARAIPSGPESRTRSASMRA